MNDLENFFYNEDHRLIHKWTNYFDIYEQYFSRFRGKQVNILEIGVAHGGSLQMWRNYFGDQCTIHGIDIDPQCERFENEYTHIHIFDQGDEKAYYTFYKLAPAFDIIIDDGSHKSKDQITSFKYLFGRMLKFNGVYLVEDTHTSFSRKFTGLFGKSFINKSKEFISKLYRWKPGIFNYIKAIHYYTGVVIIEKDAMTMPHDVQRGVKTIAGNKLNGLK